MKITDVPFGMLRVPPNAPCKTALRTVNMVEDIVAMVCTDSGQVGCGEAPAIAVIAGDTLGSINGAIRHDIAAQLIRLRAADIVNIKPMKTGGISHAIRIADIAAMHGIEGVIGCMLESSISVVAAVPLAAAKAGVITKVDLDGPLLCPFNPVDGAAIFNESEISITDAPARGIREIRGLQAIAS